MIPNFTGSCNNSPGGYVDCCRCAGHGQCPSGCVTRGGNCVPSGGSPPQPQPSPPQPQPSPCNSNQVKSLQTGKCLTITKDTKWTKDVYNSMLADMVSETGLSKEVCTCALSNITKKYSPIETKNNNSAILNIIKDCSNRKIKAVTPQLYTSDDSPDTGKSDNTKKILLIVGIILLVLALLVLGGVMIHEHNKK